MFARRIQKHARTNDVGVNEILWRIDAAIDVRLGREIHDREKLMLEHERVYRVGIGNVSFEKFVTFAMFLNHAIEIGKVAGVSQRVHICDRGRLVMLPNIANKIAPDEAAAAGHENSHSKS